jgi:hypothetical protein
MYQRERDLYVVHVIVKHIWFQSWTNNALVDLSFIWFIGWGAPIWPNYMGDYGKRLGETYGPIIIWCPHGTPLGSTHWELGKHHKAHVKILGIITGNMWQHIKDIVWTQKSIKMHPHTPSLPKENKWCPFGPCSFVFLVASNLYF